MTQLLRQLPVLDFKLFPILEFADIEVTGVTRRGAGSQRFFDPTNELDPTLGRAVPEKVPALREREFHSGESGVLRTSQNLIEVVSRWAHQENAMKMTLARSKRVAWRRAHQPSPSRRQQATAATARMTRPRAAANPSAWPIFS